MVPAKEVGGDFYDYFLLEHEGQQYLGVVIADVSGKGVPAAFFMAIARTLLKSYAQMLCEPSTTIALLNDQLATDNEQMMFVTVFFGMLNLRTGVMRYVNAGHNPPVLMVGSQPRWLAGPRNMALAAIPGLPYTPGLLQLSPGDRLFLYTDGVTEALGPGQALFGQDALLKLLAANGSQPADLPVQMLAAVRAFAGDVPQNDDITCVAIEFIGGA
jgi:sigma-B regulation protein RsbU (phosphoserine phosphatase)